MLRLGFDKLIEAKASREREPVVAMVAGRIIAVHAEYGFAMTGQQARYDAGLGRHDAGG